MKKSLHALLVYYYESSNIIKKSYFRTSERRFIDLLANIR